MYKLPLNDGISLFNSIESAKLRILKSENTIEIKSIKDLGEKRNAL